MSNIKNKYRINNYFRVGLKFLKKYNQKEK